MSANEESKLYFVYCSPELVVLSLHCQGNGIIAGLGICGVVLSTTSAAAVLMQDFRTGYICLSSPRAMFVTQVRWSAVVPALSLS